ncbi:hypothetical protein QF035_008078 [Streptomyces umbrinus]|uniref:Uncharacterized protein n=1 Tax=Streptomyces umbrinus TaxID=67370 RepID=A0ABU0T3X4_9ACTN|nr:hypothetical protein [Streptomyces umbrinus]
MPTRLPTAPSVAIDVTIITVTWRGVIPIALSMPRSRRRSRVLSTTVLKTPSAATVPSTRVKSVEAPTTVTAVAFTGDALLAPSITRRLVERFAGGAARAPPSTATSPRSRPANARC